MQRSINLHKSRKAFSRFESDMEILPSYTPIFLIDGRGRIVESRKLRAAKNGFSNIISEICENDRNFFLLAQNSHDAFAVEAFFGDGKDYLVVSKDDFGFSRCVVCSLSENNCMRLDDYYEKLSCYKDYLDSFSSLMFSSNIRTPVLRMFRMRLNGASELMRLSEGKGNDRMLTFPFSVAADKLCNVAKMLHNGADIEVGTYGSGGDVVISAPESFFKLVLCLIAYGVRCSRDGKVKVSARELHDRNLAQITLSVKAASFDSDMYTKALSGAFERSGFPFELARDRDGMTFSFVSLLGEKREEVLSDSAVIATEISNLLSQESIYDMYRTVADI